MDSLDKIPDLYTAAMAGTYKTRQGGYLSEIPQPHIRKWPGAAEPRPVKVDVVRYALGTHYYVTIEEARNPVWNPQTDDGGFGPCWQLSWDDDASKGKRFDAHCETYNEARTFVYRIIHQHFTDPTYRVTITNHGCETQTMRFVRREGD